MSARAVTLPSETAVLRCADFSRTHEVDPGGTALAPDVVLLVEVAPPWPKPAAKHETLRRFVKAAAASSETIRVLAAVPHDLDRPRLLAFRRTPTGLTRAEVGIGTDPVADLRAALLPEAGVAVPADSGPRTVLICAHGSYDVCCGTRGVELADWADAALTGVEVFRVSHTGGHRFAPTAMTLPDGRMWAYLTPERLQAVLERTMEPAAAARLSRGWWGAPTGPPQAAERAVFAEEGWAVDGAPRTVGVELGADGRSVVEVRIGERAWTVTVEPGREIPTIACEAPGGLPAKSGREWRVTRIVRR